MNKDRLFNRVNGLMEQGMDRVSMATDHLQERLRNETEALAKSAKTTLDRGRDRFMTLEEGIMKSIRDNPTRFIIGGVALIGLIVAGSFFFSSRRDRSEW